ncbi:MAG: response regulator [bacterium]
MEDKPQILVIDDNAGVCISLVFLLQNDYAVITVNSAQEGIAKMDEGFDPAVILLDLCMPDASGLDVLDELHLTHADTPIIILTGIGDPDVLSTTLQRGAFGYLEKPFSRRGLREMIAAAMANQRSTLGESQ